MVGCVSPAATCTARCGFFATYHWVRCCLLSAIVQATWFRQLLLFQATSKHSGLVGVLVVLVLARVVPSATGKCSTITSRVSLSQQVGVRPAVVVSSMSLVFSTRKFAVCCKFFLQTLFVML